MLLYHQYYPSPHSGAPLVIIHGLFGDGGNWRSIARQLSPYLPVITFDLPNHGSSAHTQNGSYDYLVQSILETLSDLGIERAHFLGHSMGGKAVLQLALTFEALVVSLVVVDIVPKTYPGWHSNILAGLAAVNNAKLTSRKAADVLLASYEKEAAVRAFLLKNLVLDNTDACYRWRFNWRIIDKYYEHLCSWEISGEKKFLGPSLLVRGEMSNYVPEEDTRHITQYCPTCIVSTIQGAGHWVHAEKQQQFCEVVIAFLQKLQEVREHI